MQGTDACTFIAFENTGSVGLVSAFRDAGNSRMVELVSMWVAPRARRRGVGTMLINAIFDWAKAANDINAIALWVARGNDDVVEFYKRRGFAVDGGDQPIPHGNGIEGRKLICPVG